MFMAKQLKLVDALIRRNEKCHTDNAIIFFSYWMQIDDCLDFPFAYRKFSKIFV